MWTAAKGVVQCSLCVVVYVIQTGEVRTRLSPTPHVYTNSYTPIGIDIFLGNSTAKYNRYLDGRSRWGSPDAWSEGQGDSFRIPNHSPLTEQAQMAVNHTGKLNGGHALLFTTSGPAPTSSGGHIINNVRGPIYVFCDSYIYTKVREGCSVQFGHTLCKVS